jgi:competence protein ComEA
MRLSRTGVFLRLLATMLACAVMASGIFAGQTSKKTKSSDASKSGSKNASTANGKVDLNTASAEDLDGLPGVGAATAKKIIAGRPYSSVSDLSKAGLSASVIAKITPLVTVSGGTAAAASPKPSAPAPAAQPSAPASGQKVDLNTASEKDLDSLPGVGPATAKKIVAGRPYSSVGDLSKAGLSASVIAKIAPLATASGAPAAANSMPSTPISRPSMPAPSTPAPSQPAPASAAKPAPSAASQGTAGPGMVWVNTDSGVFHYSNSRYYGKTKVGKYLSEADALKAGYHAAENEKKPQ